MRSGAIAGAIAAHTVAELYSILSTLPVKPRLAPASVLHLIKSNVLGVFEVICLSEDDYIGLIEELAGLGIVGGATYDALILQAAANANVDQVVTLNEKDFRRVSPSLADRIITP